MEGDACEDRGREQRGGVERMISEEEYLRTTCKPDCEFLDGELAERKAGTSTHSMLQGLLTGYFGRRRKLWGIHVYPGVRIRIRQRRYLIPDLAIISGPKPVEAVFTTPPLIWIEILSPEDKPIRVNRKVRELLEFGVPYIWIIDPETLESEVHTQHGGTSLTDGIFRVPNTPIEVPLQALEED